MSLAIEGELTIDVRSLNKGDFLDPDTIEKVVGHKADTPQYGLSCMGLKVSIERDSIGIGTPFIVKHEKAGLRILTDDEAVDYLEGRHNSHVMGIKRVYAKLNRVDVGKLTGEQEKAYERRMLIQGRTVQAIDNAYRGLEFPVVEETNGLLED